ncbi:MAG: nucleotidyltransferase domain-containing protein [Bifidobacteriaceae bacterium]|jgi:predicted nucleotidyltransferase|nr:nucleotidyltransferase domain-containing protein [Bifidobacteriaceae bacterium]
MSQTVAAFVPASARGRRSAARRVEVVEAALRSGYTDVKVFGSEARGDDGDQSDVDLAVTPTGSHSLFKLMRLGIDLGELLDERVDVVSEPDLRPKVAERVRQEAALL